MSRIHDNSGQNNVQDSGQNNSQIIMIDFTWLHNIPLESVQWGVDFYGVSDSKFQELLGSLGLQTYNGNDKKAFAVLREEAKIWGW